MERRCERLLSGGLLTSAWVILSWMTAESLVSTSQYSPTCMLPHSVTELCTNSVVQLWGQEHHLILLESITDLARHWEWSRLLTNDWRLLVNSRWYIIYFITVTIILKSILKCLSSHRTRWNNNGWDHWRLTLKSQIFEPALVNTQNTQICSKGSMLLPSCLPEGSHQSALSHQCVRMPTSQSTCQNYHFLKSLPILWMKMKLYFYFQLVVRMNTSTYWPFVSPFVANYLFISFVYRH